MTNLPKYVRKGKSAYEYRAYVPGQPRRTVRLCPLDAPMSEVWRRWEALQGGATDTLGWLLDRYMASREFRFRGGRPKSEDTIHVQTALARRIKAQQLADGRLFTEVPLKAITPGVIRKYLDKRAEDGAAASANREKSIISTAWRWALSRDKIEIPNPCPVVAGNPQSPKTRYVTDQEYAQWIQFVRYDKPHPYLWIASEMAYLCRMRRIEILGATKGQVLGEGFDTLRRKGSRDAVTAWSPRLREAIDAALALPVARTMSATHLIHDRYGRPIIRASFNSAWYRNMKLSGLKFGIHDLKRKGATDSDEDATISTGNTPRVAKIYDVSKLRARPTK